MEGNIEKKVFIENEKGIKYICLHNRDKLWIYPTENCRNAGILYQPTMIKGKVLKKLAFNKKTFFLLGEKVEEKKLSIEQSIYTYVKDVTKQENFIIAGYRGDRTSKQNNKITLQVYDEKKVICYAKVSSEKEVICNMKKEKEALFYLKEKGIEGIPDVLGYTEIEGVHIFVQSSKKETNEKVRLKFDEKQIEFVDNMVTKTLSNITYENSDFYKSVQNIKIYMNTVTEKNKAIIERVIRIIENRKDELKFSFFHGDFTPWNMYYQNNNLQVFDFEYCSYSMPAYMDLFHYLTEMYIWGKGYNVEKFIKKYSKIIQLLGNKVENTKLIYMCYLTYILDFYTKRTKVKGDEYNYRIKCLIEIMEKLI